MKQKPRPRLIPREKLPPCSFCKEKRNPNYKNYESLAVYLSDRAKIIGSRRSGVCSKHQKFLTKAIKRARVLGLLPFTSRP